MRTLDRKLLRDLRLLWSQVLTIALVVASGVAGFVATQSAVGSLAAARDDFYERARFADLFAVLVRAPLAEIERLRALPGVADLQATVEQQVRVEVDGDADPVVGHLIGWDPDAPARLNQAVLRAGRWLEPGLRSGDAVEALVNEGFAAARGLGPGSRVRALVNGKRRELRIVGVVVSPEYVYAGRGGSPDLRGFGVFWVDREALAAAYDMRGAFNRVAIRLAPAASEQATVDAVQRQLAPWGGIDAHGRSAQASHEMLDGEIRGQRVLGTVLPAVFLAVAAFLLNVVVSRLVATQREQVAALKALGYGDEAIAAHYLALVLAIAAVGLALGFAVGDRLGAGLTGLFAEVFRFPSFEHRVAPWIVAVAIAVTVATTALGTLSAIRATVRLAPAEAMRPPAPARYRRTLVERLGLRALGPASRMVLRNLERRPVRAALAVLGVAASVAIVVVGHFVRDAMDHVVDSQFNVTLRGDVIVWMAEPVDDAARHALARLPGVIGIEAGRDVPVRFVAGHASERGAIQGLDARPDLRRIIDVDGRETRPDGLVMTDRLAAKLRLRVGDPVDVEVRVGRRRTLRLVLTATVREMVGLNAYMERGALNGLLGDGDLASQYTLSVERGREPELLAATRALPRVAGAFSKAAMLRNMQEVSARNVRIMSTVMTVFAAVIAVGVVYNNARIALAERAWELASLRVLGFTRVEVSAMLLGELALLTAVALPLGMAMGRGLAQALVGLLATDQFAFPAVVQPRTYAWAALCVLVAAAASALVVRRNVDRLDLVGALKTRE